MISRGLLSVMAHTIALVLVQVPMLDTPLGPVFESTAIARHLARLGADKGLFGSSLIEQVSAAQEYPPSFWWNEGLRVHHDAKVDVIISRPHTTMLQS